MELFMETSQIVDDIDDDKGVVVFRIFIEYLSILFIGIRNIFKCLIIPSLNMIKIIGLNYDNEEIISMSAIGIFICRLTISI